MKGVNTSDDVSCGIDNLLLDLNGIFHNSTQKIYKYGNYKEPRRLLKPSKPQKPKIPDSEIRLLVFQDICDTIDKLIKTTNPQKRLVLCIDGPAPMAKQMQQRQRRFRSAKDSGDTCPFETCNITPGTDFLDQLSKYIEWYIKKSISTNSLWKNLDVVFSDEKVPGEGEQKCFNFIRKYGDETESYCIHGLDADLVMLGLSTLLPKFYILRDELYDNNFDYILIDVGAIAKELSGMMRWESNIKVSNNLIIYDFVFLVFTVGNDFLPHIPSIEILQGGIELIIQTYKKVCSLHGHITSIYCDEIRFNKNALQMFFSELGSYEKQNYENKLKTKDTYYEDKMLEFHATELSEGWEVDINSYSIDYHNTHFEGSRTEDVCHKYLEGMQWVMNYYTKGVPNWNWLFPYHYAPSASVLATHIQSFHFVKYPDSHPTTPFQQLLCVLPPKCSNLLPPPLDELLTSVSSPLHPYCPTDFKIDLAGKKHDWEGTVLVGNMDFDVMNKEYSKFIEMVSQKDRERDTINDAYIYVYTNEISKKVKSVYGNFTCKYRELPIDF